MATSVVFMRAARPKAAVHFQVRSAAAETSLRHLPDVARFGQLALSAAHALAGEYCPQGFRVIMRVGENGCQAAGEPLTIDLIGGEVLRTSVKSLYDPNQPVTASEVDNKPDEECVFDKIVSGQIPVKPIINEDGVFVFKPTQPLAPEHLLFIPTEHYRDLLGVKDPAFFGSVFTKIAQIAERPEFAGGFILETNNRSWGGQVVPHLHFHMRGGEKLASPFWQDWQG